MFTEDLAALENLTEESILNELHERLRLGFFHTFIGDILLILNPNEEQDIYGLNVSSKCLGELSIIVENNLLLVDFYFLHFSIILNINANHDPIIHHISIQLLTVPTKMSFITKNLNMFSFLERVILAKQLTCFI